MQSRWVKGLLAIAALIGGALIAATFLDTTIRPATFDPPGYLVTTITSPDRAKPVRLHIWYPTDSTAASELIGQNGLFYGSHMRRDAVPAPGAMPVGVVSHESGGNAERLGWLAGIPRASGDDRGGTGSSGHDVGRQ
jgi:predicted dienelactone hydrolase